MEGDGVVVERGLDGRIAREPVSPFMLAFGVLTFRVVGYVRASRRGLDGSYGWDRIAEGKSPPAAREKPRPKAATRQRIPISEVVGREPREVRVIC